MKKLISKRLLKVIENNKNSMLELNEIILEVNIAIKIYKDIAKAKKRKLIDLIENEMGELKWVYTYNFDPKHCRMSLAMNK